MEQTTKESEIRSWTNGMVLALGIALLIRYFLFIPIVVDGESMQPTLVDGDRMVVNKIGYNVGEPKRYDIVVFHASKDSDYIKRIIGLPGDHIAYKNDRLYVNEEPQNEPYLDAYKADLSEGEGTLTEDFSLEEKTGKSTIPKGYVFVMGDNRRNSTDSRVIGLVPIKEIVGNTTIVFWSPDEIRLVK
jgi:signal peptidase I